MFSSYMAVNSYNLHNKTYSSLGQGIYCPKEGFVLCVLCFSRYLISIVTLSYTKLIHHLYIYSAQFQLIPAVLGKCSSSKKDVNSFNRQQVVLYMYRTIYQCHYFIQYKNNTMWYDCQWNNCYHGLPFCHMESIKLDELRGFFIFYLNFL